MNTERASMLVSATLFLVTVAVNLETPLYPEYAKLANVGGGITSLVFAMYTVALLLCLILFGGASDRVGRKPMLLLGLSSSLLATIAMILFPNMNALFVARLLQGVGVGLSIGAGTAYLSELNPSRADRVAMYVGMMTSLGFGMGALLTSLFISFGMTLVPLSYWLVVIATGVCLWLLWRLPAYAPSNPTAKLVRLPFFNPLVIKMGLLLAIAWAVTGIVIAVLPLQLSKYGLASWAGVALFAINGTGALVQPIARRFEPNTALKIGLFLVPMGYAVLVFGAWTGIIALVVGGASLAGSGCYGFTYYGALSRVTRDSPSEHRARAMSGFFTLAYAGFSFPSVVIGFLSESIGVIPAMSCFGVLVLMASLVGLGWVRPIAIDTPPENAI